jgi:lipopolysaccharide/colanic/teichoic acid biosynthesis glycosyltransferase
LYKKLVKPLFDLLIAMVACLLALVPCLVIVCVLRWAHGKGGVFFTQQRPGKNELIFRLFKFKTMNNQRDLSGNLLPDEERITLIGRIIRKTSIDELPQLWNVLKGDMSLVGPRPLLVEYLPLYNEHQKRRHEVKPGITGWAQVNGRNAISWKEKFELDVWYVDHCSFSLDMKILWLTILKVFKREGINQAGQATVEKFNGYN